MKGDVLAESLRVHKPLASAFKILHKPSLGGTSRTTKFPGKEHFRHNLKPIDSTLNNYFLPSY